MKETMEIVRVPRCGACVTCVQDRKDNFSLQTADSALEFLEQDQALSRAGGYRPAGNRTRRRRDRES
jgi:hypothetical protein